MPLKLYPRTKLLLFSNSLIVLRSPRLADLPSNCPFLTPTRRMSSTTPSTASSPAQTLPNYSFPKHHLRTIEKDATKDPIVLVACGSYNPITIAHLQMFEMASEFVTSSTAFEIMGSYLSPVSDAYKKPCLAPSIHRLRMCELAINSQPRESRLSRVMLDPWEALQPSYTLTAQVMNHFNHEINEVLGGAQMPDGRRVAVRIMLLAGADLVGSMSTPGLWSDEDLQRILGDGGAFVVKRKGTDIEEALSSLKKWRDNIYVLEPPVTNDVSSTKIREYAKRGCSIKDLTPDTVINYIEEHGLYRDKGVSSSDKEGC